MARSKTHKEDEDIRGLLREKERIIKALKKHIRKLEKEIRIQEKDLDNDEFEEQEVEMEVTSPSCQQCKRGAIAFTDLGIKVLKSCVVCGWRKTVPK